MSELTYKKIIDVEQVETLNDTATVFVNDNGAMKQVAADKFGAVKTVNGVAPDENGNIVVEVPELAKPDWNQNDPDAPDYVKNRTHYAETETAVLLESQSIEITDASQPFVCAADFEFTENEIYNVLWDGVEYECEAYIAQGPNIPSLGSGALGGLSGGNGEPFFITIFEGDSMVFAQETGTHTIIVQGTIARMHKINAGYLPDATESQKGAVQFGSGKKKAARVINTFFDATREEFEEAYELHRNGGCVWKIAGDLVLAATGAVDVAGNAKNPKGGARLLLAHNRSGENMVHAYNDENGNFQMERGIHKTNQYIYLMSSEATSSNAKVFRLSVNDAGELSIEETTI